MMKPQRGLMMMRKMTTSSLLANLASKESHNCSVILFSFCGSGEVGCNIMGDAGVILGWSRIAVWQSLKKP